MIKFFILIVLFILLYVLARVDAYYIRRINLFMFFAILSMILFFFFNNETKNLDKKYISPKYDGEKIKSGNFSEEN